MRNFFLCFFSTKIAKECFKAKSAGPVPITGMKGQVPPRKNAPTRMHSAVSGWTRAQNLKPLMSFAHKVSSSVKPLLKSVSKLTMARFSKSIQGGKQTQKTFEVKVFFSQSLVLSLIFFLLQCTKADKIIFSDNKLLLFIYFFLVQQMLRDTFSGYDKTLVPSLLPYRSASFLKRGPQLLR